LYSQQIKNSKSLLAVFVTFIQEVYKKLMRRMVSDHVASNDGADRLMREMSGCSLHKEWHH